MPLGAIIGAVGRGLTARSMRKRQERALRELKESNFISPALLEAEAEAQKSMNASRYSGQDIDEANIRQASANAMDNVARSTTSSANLVNAAMGIQTNQNRANQGLSRVLQDFKRSNKANWRNTLVQKGQQQLANRRQYEASKSALQGAIMANRATQSNALWNAAGGLVDAGAMALSGGGTGLGAMLRKGGFGAGGGNFNLGNMDLLRLMQGNNSNYLPESDYA